jgi:hypothetical protein
MINKLENQPIKNIKLIKILMNIVLNMLIWNYRLFQFVYAKMLFKSRFIKN